MKRSIRHKQEEQARATELASIRRFYEHKNGQRGVVPSGGGPVLARPKAYKPERTYQAGSTDREEKRLRKAALEATAKK